MSTAVSNEAPPPKSPRRRTLQSGFSLMARGEPKIWLTGGMLVICLFMIISLLTLIIMSGLATFWPGPIDWLLLTDQQMEIGEPQRSEVRADGDRPGNEKGKAELSRFYRTANFDITNRHYRWIEPEELGVGSIVRPEWALLIERQSWGRMLALPSRLSRPLNSANSQLDKQLEAIGLLQEFSGELEPLAAEEPALPLDTLSNSLTSQMALTRAEQLRTAIASELATKRGTVQFQTDENAAWATVDGPLADAAAVSAARVIIDEPAALMHEIQPILAQLARVRAQTEQAMHTISLLDRDLSDARVAVRQAELDTGSSVLEKIDDAGPKLEALAANQQVTDRVQAIIANAKSLMPQTDSAEQLKTLLERYLTKVLQPARQTLQDDLSNWQSQFANEPTAIQAAINDFVEAWTSTLARKRPLELSIQQSESQTQGFELQVLVPTDGVNLEVSAADTLQLLDGKWTDAVVEQLAAQSIAPDSSPPRVLRFNDRVVQVEFVDAARGKFCLWGWKNADDSYVWQLPQQKTLNCAEIVRIFPANRLTLFGKMGVYLARWREFLFDNPREANTEGGVFPAIWGTIVMTLIMTLAVVPFGVIAALYLREYTRSGPIVSLVRISINNLAGVPSIVYGVFGLAFFCYSMGAFIDGGAKNAQFGVLPGNAWYLTLTATVAVGVCAFLFGFLGSGVHPSQGGLKQRLAKIAPALWFLSLIGAGVLIFKSPFFDGFYEARLPAPTFGKEGLLWASLTLALLTLPVVIVATEEALSAVPNSLREGSLACGASKWQTIYRIVLPHARPGILTGAILAMARGIGEVAPLMLVGALPVAPDLPLDTEFPYFHGSRSFMHLGYQIYWLGFQSQNSEASKPLVFTCTLLLILIVISLNLAAILLRASLRRRFQGNQF